MRTDPGRTFVLRSSLESRRMIWLKQRKADHCVQRNGHSDHQRKHPCSPSPSGQMHAQREACEAYVKSQKHEGWVVLPARYDDGGISGATLERPALQQLLADIRARKVDTVVVYKVDRLTRSLADFAKIVEIFDVHGVAFVSVTQHFNTTTSMGRLTLNYCCRSHSLSAKSPVSASGTRLRRRSRGECGWAAIRHSAMTSATASWWSM